MTFAILAAVAATMSLALFSAARPEERRVLVRVRDDREPREPRR